MKKILFIAAACLALFGCKESAPEEVSVPAAIEVTPRSVTFDAEGGSADVIVTSTGEWTLTAASEYNWLEASMEKGEDGDIITFTVDPNTTADKKADFTFTTGDMGEATCTFSVFSYAGEAPEFEILSDKNVELDYNAGQLEILVSVGEKHYRDVECTLSAGAAEWLDYQATIHGDTEHDAKIYYNVEALEGLADREATITVSVPGYTPVEIDVKQFAKHVLSVPSSRYTVAIEGETIVIPLTTNVEYNMEMTGATGWLTATTTADGISFTATALQGDKRSATVTFTQTDAEEGEEALSASVTITQVKSIVKWAADMTGNRLFPKWDGPNGGPGTLEAFTLEALVKFDDFNKASGGIFTIMGIEGKFLLRMGDVGNALTNLQVATSYGNYNCPFVCEANRWYHIAVVFQNSKAYVYFDGNLEGTSQEFNLYNYYFLDSVNLSPAWSYEPSGNRCFWMGYSYEANRDIHGQMTEIRIWNKALTAEEINAENHFYTVDPQSEGLFSYWKFVEGEGNTVADATGCGNSLYGETDVRKQGNDNKGDNGIEWVEVALPDK